MKGRELGSLFKAAVAGWWDDNVPRLGASLAYYTLFSLAPILVVAIAIAGFFFGREAVRGEIVMQIQDLVGFQSAKAVQSMLESAAKPSTGVLATVIGGLTFFIGATGAFLELQAALNAIWRVKPKEGAGLRELFLPRLISFGLVIGVGFLLLVSLVISAALAALNKYMGELVPGLTELWIGLNVLVSLGVITLLFAMVYKFLPDVKLGWRDVWVGALVTAGLFTIGKSAIGLYLGTSTTASSYGAAGSVVVLLVWVYYSAQIVLLGAEFTRVYVERMPGAPPAPVPGAEPDPEPAAVGGSAAKPVARD